MGIVPTGCTPAPSRPCSEEPAGSALVEASLYLRRRAETVAHVFRSRLRPTPLSCDARLVDGEPVQAVVHLARASDLVVVGQADEAAAVGSAERRLPEEVMLNAGRPVLIVPSTGCVKEGLDRILVAWDGSRKASISLRGAMPLLRKAAHVTLVSLLRDGDANPADALNPVEMSGWLLRHGVQANVERLTTSLRFADVLLDRAEALGCELLVMGGGWPCPRAGAVAGRRDARHADAGRNSPVDGALTRAATAAPGRWPRSPRDLRCRPDGKPVQQRRHAHGAACGAFRGCPLGLVGHPANQGHHAIGHAHVDIAGVDGRIPVELGEDIVSELNVRVHGNPFLKIRAGRVSFFLGAGRAGEFSRRAVMPVLRHINIVPTRWRLDACRTGAPWRVETSGHLHVLRDGSPIPVLLVHASHAEKADLAPAEASVATAA